MSSNEDSSRGEPAYKVGRNRPPLHSRFQKGRSGNPAGRKRGCRNFKSLMEEAMSLEVTTSLDGKPRRIILPLAVMYAEAHAALKGNVRAAEQMLRRYERMGIGEGGEEIRLPDEDRAILDRAMSRMSAAQGGDETEEKPSEALGEYDEEVDDD